MRLIDADRLPMNIEWDDIEKAPTFTLVQHGHWFKNGRDWQCSVCREICNRVYDSYEQKCTDYCGCCGAKMDEKVSE